MKRILRVFLVASMMFSLVSCGGGSTKAMIETATNSTNTADNMAQATDRDPIDFTLLADPETSDMPTFYMGDWPSDITEEDVAEFVRLYGGQEVRFIDVYFDTALEDYPGCFFDTYNRIGFVDEDPELYEDIDSDDVLEWCSVVWGYVSTESTEAIMIVPPGNGYVFRRGDPDEWWKDDYEYVSPYEPVIDYSDPILVDAKDVGGNVARAEYLYKDQVIALYNVRVYDITTDHVSVMYTAGDASYYTCSFDDFVGSGAINLNEDDYVMVVGLCTGSRFFNDGLNLSNCYFEKTGHYYSGGLYGALDDAFSQTMDQIYGSAWRGLF